MPKDLTVGAGQRTNPINTPQPASSTRKPAPGAVPPGGATPANAGSKRGDLARLGVNQRHALEIKLQQQTRERNESNPAGSIITGATTSNRARLRETQPIQTWFGYPNRTAQSDRAVNTVADVMDRNGVGTGAAPTISAGVRRDGSIVVGISGTTERAGKVPPRIEAALQQQFNQDFASDSQIRRVNGNVQFSFATVTADTTSFRPPQTRTVEGNTRDISGDSSRCVEGKSYSSRNGASGNFEALSVRNRPAEGKTNPHPDRVNNPDGNLMAPCNSCRQNASNIMDGTRSLQNAPNRTAAAFRGTGTSARVGGSVAFGVSLYQQVSAGEGIRPGELAAQTATGAGTAVAGEMIERTVTQRMLVNSGASTSRFALAARGMPGAAAAGAVINTGFAIRDNYAAFRSGDISGAEYTGRITGEAVVGAAAGVGGALAGAYLGAAIGSVVPGAGTVAGFVIGGAVGFGIDYAARRLGANTAIANGVTAAIDGGANLARQAGQAGTRLANQVGETGTRIAQEGTRLVQNGVRSVNRAGAAVVEGARATVRQHVATARQVARSVSHGARAAHAFVGERVTAARQQISHGARAAVQYVSQARQQVTQTVNRAVTNVADTARATVNQAREAVSNTVNRATQSVSNALGGATNTLRSIFGN